MPLNGGYRSLEWALTPTVPDETRHADLCAPLRVLHPHVAAEPVPSLSFAMATAASTSSCGMTVIQGEGSPRARGSRLVEVGEHDRFDVPATSDPRRAAAAASGDPTALIPADADVVLDPPTLARRHQWADVRPG
jgi:hypothetical protein